MDFRNVTRLFADPAWDGPVEQDPGFDSGAALSAGGPPPDADTPPSAGGTYKPIVGADGCRVEIIHKTVSIYDTGGRLLRQESIVDYTRMVR